jgi:hypothetical protein
MNTKSVRSVVLAAAMLVGSSVALFAADAPKEDAALATKLVNALIASDYDTFIADGEAPFQQLKKPQFEAVAAQLGPKLKAIREMSYLGELNQKGYHVTLWKISFKDGGDDALATLSVKAGKVGGFFIR